MTLKQRAVLGIIAGIAIISVSLPLFGAAFVASSGGDFAQQPNDILGSYFAAKRNFAWIYAGLFVMLSLFAVGICAFRCIWQRLDQSQQVTRNLNRLLKSK